MMGGGNTLTHLKERPHAALPQVVSDCCGQALNVHGEPRQQLALRCAVEESLHDINASHTAIKRPSALNSRSWYGSHTRWRAGPQCPETWTSNHASPSKERQHRQA